MTVTSFSKLIALILFVLLPFAGFFLGMQYQMIMNQNQELIDKYKWDSYTAEKEPSNVVYGIFSGALTLCNDCDVIHTQLTLYSDGKSNAPRTFLLNEIFPSDRENAVETVGTWNMIQGTKKDSKAIVYQLNGDGSVEPRYFQKVNDNELLPLDKSLVELKLKQQHTLLKE